MPWKISDYIYGSVLLLTIKPGLGVLCGDQVALTSADDVLVVGCVDFNIYSNRDLPVVDGGGSRLCEGYPTSTTTISGQTSDDCDMEAWKEVPRTSDFTGWVKVVPGPRIGSKARSWRVLYDEAIRPPNNPRHPWSLCLHVYGFVTSMNLSRAGNWDE